MGRIGACLAVIASYMLVRAGIYAALPADNFEQWWFRDLVMDAPRLAAFGATAWLGARWWGRRTMGLHFDRAAVGLFIGVPLTLLWSSQYWFRAVAYDLAPGPLIVLAVSSFIVGLFEETMFRGVFFGAIAEKRSPHAAVWLTSVSFAVFHVQAQPVTAWPSIFLIALVFSCMRWRGVGLGWLILIHGAYDTLIFMGGVGEFTVPGYAVALLGAKVLVAAGVYIWARRAGPVVA